MPKNPPPHIQALLDAIERAGPVSSIAELNRIAAQQMRGYNARPQAELGGLSPDQMQQLLYGDWMTQGALRLNDTLTAAETADIPSFADAGTILSYVRDNAPVKQTATKNLSRAAVAALLPLLRTNVLAREYLGEFKQVNESDVHWLSILRHTLMFAGLLARRKGFVLTARGRRFLEPHRVGESFALLFRRCGHRPRRLARRAGCRALRILRRHGKLPNQMPATGRSIIAFSIPS